MKEKRGNLSATGFPELLDAIYSRKDPAGILEIIRGPVKKRIFFKDGYPVFATSNILSEVLGRLLMQEGVLSQSDYERSLEIVRKEKKKHGSVLISLGLITAEELDRFLTLQLRRRLLNLFGWTEGAYQYVKADKLPEGLRQYPLNPARLILEGITLGFYPSANIEKDLVPYMDEIIFRKKGAGRHRLEELRLNLQEKRFLESIDGTRPLRKVLEESELLRHKGLALMLSFIVTGFVTTVEEKTEEKIGQEELMLLKKLEQDLLKFRSMDLTLLFKQIGGGKDPDGAYERLSRGYRPENFSGMNPGIRDVASEIFELLTDAYETVLEGQKKKLEEKAPIASKEAAEERRLKAEILFIKAKAAISKKDYANAAATLKEIVALAPEEGEYRAYLGWALFNMDAEKWGEAEDTIKQALAISSELDSAWYFLGRIYLSAGEESRCIEAMKTALSKNPWMTEAFKALKGLEIKRTFEDADVMERVGYMDFYGFEEAPFPAVAPPGFFIPTKREADALVFLSEEVKKRSCHVCLIGERGTGKTTTLVGLLSRLKEEKVLCSMILDPPQKELDLIRLINEDIGFVSESASVKEQLVNLNLRASQTRVQNGFTLVMVDEAHRLSAGGFKLLQVMTLIKGLVIIVAGEPALVERLGTPELADLNRKLSGRFLLKNLSLDEMISHMAKRLSLAKERITLTPEAAGVIYEASSGNTGLVNRYSSLMLKIASGLNTFTLDKGVAERALGKPEKVEASSGEALPSETLPPEKTRPFVPNKALVEELEEEIKTPAKEPFVEKETFMPKPPQIEKEPVLVEKKPPVIQKGPPKGEKKGAFEKDKATVFKPPVTVTSAVKRPAAIKTFEKKKGRAFAVRNVVVLVIAVIAIMAIGLAVGSIIGVYWFEREKTPEVSEVVKTPPTPLAPHSPASPVEKGASEDYLTGSETPVPRHAP